VGTVCADHQGNGPEDHGRSTTWRWAPGLCATADPGSEHAEQDDEDDVDCDPDQRRDDQADGRAGPLRLLVAPLCGTGSAGYGGAH
jgi:hypothetical protein